MKIREFQEHIVERLNGVEALVQGGCKAFAEDTRIAASRQRHRGSHAGLDYVERIYAAPSSPARKIDFYGLTRERRRRYNRSMQSTFGKHDEYDDYIMGIIVLATADIFIWDFVWSYIKYCF